MADGLEAKVKQYEGKLATLTAINGVLQAENDRLKDDLEDARNPTTDAEEELAELKEEFAERLGEAQSQVAKYKDECKRLNAQLKVADKGGTVSSVKLAEKEQTIAALRSEGETISRRNGELEAQLRKLKSTDREKDAERDRLSAKVQALEAQILSANERADRVAAEASQQTEALEHELEEMQRRHAQQISSAKEEARRAVDQADQERQRGGVEQLAAAQERETALTEALQSTRELLAQRQSEWDLKEAALQREILQMKEALREAEVQKDETQYSSTEATKPLLKQIEAMATQHAAREAAQKTLERSLTVRLRDVEDALASAEEAERTAKRRAAAAEAAVNASKEAAGTAVVSAAELRSRLDGEWKKAATLQAEKDALRQQLEMERQVAEEERTASEASKRDLQEQLWEAEQKLRNLSAERNDAVERLAAASRGSINNHLPTSVSLPAMVSPGAKSPLAGTTQANGNTQLPVSADPSQSEDLDTYFSSMASLSSMPSSVPSIHNDFLSRAPSQAGVLAQIEILSTQLREAQQTRDYNAEELCRVLERLDAAESAARSATELREENSGLNGKLDVCLEILGARNLKIEQLEDDIAEMKRIFHQQLDVCVGQLGAARSELDAIKAAHGE